MDPHRRLYGSCPLFVLVSFTNIHDLMFLNPLFSIDSSFCSNVTGLVCTCAKTKKKKKTGNPQSSFVK